MHRFLQLFSTPVTRWPGRVLVVVLLAVAIPAAFLPSLTLEVDLTEFRSDSSESGQAMAIVEDSFIDSGAFVQVVLDAGPDGNILSSDGIEALFALDQQIVETVGEDARLDSNGQPQIRSVPSFASQMVQAQGMDTGTLSDVQISQLVSQTVSERTDVAELMSHDLNVDEGSARAAVSIVVLDSELGASEREAVSSRLETSLDAVAVEQLAGFEVMVVSESLFENSIQAATQDEAPILFGTALLVIIVILGFMYRAVLDVVIGLLGLVLTIVGTFGIAALLGPSYLGVTGPLSQLAILVPVLIIGLGVDFAVHLTTRYKEQRESGDGPRRAANRAIHTVGAALVLASAATVVGFGANAFAPLQITADFAIQIAIGILVAFLVMGFAVPSARVLIDRRASLAVPSEREQQQKADRMMDQPARFAARLPLAGALFAAILASGSLVAATDLEISFDRDDFVPSGSHAELLRDRQDELFGGQLDDVTYVVVEGDLTDPALVNAMFEAEQALADVPYVATVAGEPQVRSLNAMFQTVLSTEGQPADNAPALSPEMIGWNGEGFAPEANLEPVYAMMREQIGESEFEMFVNSDHSQSLVQIQTTAGDSAAGELRAALSEAYTPISDAGGETHITSASMIMSEMSDELAGFQLQSLGMTLVIVVVILAGYYGFANRAIALGIIAMIPAVVSASLLLGTMWVLGISVNAVTATMTAIAVGIGVPYGVHVVNRFAEEISRGLSPDDSARKTLKNTGRAIVGSGLTTFGAFVVLSFANLGPVQQLGMLGAFGIAFALLAAIFVMPGVLILWARRQGSTYSDLEGAQSTPSNAGTPVRSGSSSYGR
jgi:uncharacterized protein